MTDDELNEILYDLADASEYAPDDLVDSGKAIPYIGWFWRRVDFDRPLYLGVIPGAFAGFMQNNKWGYPSFVVSDEDRDRLREMLVDFATEPTKEKAAIIYTFIQGAQEEE